MKKYCVYITIYLGNKMPMYYIGYTLSKKILEGNYRGSVTSKKYKRIWERELQENFDLFKIKILKYFDCGQAARNYESKIQKHFNVRNNSMYINISDSSYGSNYGYFCIYKNEEHKYIPKGSTIPDGWAKGESKTRIDNRRKAHPKTHKLTEAGLLGIKEKRSGENSSSKREDVRRKISETTKRNWENTSPEQKEKISQKYREMFTGENNPFFGKTHSEETKSINSEKHKNIVVAKDKNNNIIRVSKEEFLKREDLVGVNDGFKWITDGKINKHFYEGNIIPEGWKFGFTYIQKKKRIKGKCFWNNGIERKFQLECPGEGWVKGKINV